MSNGFQQGWRPGPLASIKADRFQQEVDDSLQRSFTNHYNLAVTAVTAPTFGGGFALAQGKLSVLGSKTGVDTGLGTVDNTTASINAGSTAHNFTLSVRPSPLVLGAIDIFVWMPTAAGDTTPIPATTAVNVAWQAMGSPK